MELPAFVKAKAGHQISVTLENGIVCWVCDGIRQSSHNVAKDTVVDPFHEPLDARLLNGLLDEAGVCLMVL